MKIYPCDISLGEFLPCEQSVGALLADRAVRFSDKPLLLERLPGQEEFTKFYWRDVHEDIRRVAQALCERGVERGERVAILSPNRREMFITIMALYSIGAVSVPIFFGYFPDQVAFILEHSGAKTLIAADSAQADKLKKPFPELKNLYLFDKPETFRGEMTGLKAQAFADLLKATPGPLLEKRIAGTSANDTCVIMYTSGTTGRPKGVELTHRNLISQQKAFGKIWDLTSNDRFLSYLPWHHCFGGNFETFMAVYFGVPMALDASRGKDLDLLLANYEKIKPTFYQSVPAVFQMMIREMHQNPALEKIIFHPQLRAVFTAAAPLPPDIYKVFNDRGIPVHEGWGLTEASPDITLTRVGKTYSPGIVGEVIPGCELKIDTDGEIFARGPNIMKGYYRDPEATAKVLDSEGWLRTGDLGEVTNEGLRIVGRADGVFKLVNGEKVPSSHLEGMLISCCSFVDKAVAVGSGRDFVVAVLYPNEKMLTAWAKEKGLHFDCTESLLGCDEVKALFIEGVRKANQSFDAKYYRVRRFHLSPQPPTLERGELTPTSKVCRKQVIQNYLDIIDDMYHGMNVRSQKPFVTV